MNNSIDSIMNIFYTFGEIQHLSCNITLVDKRTSFINTFPTINKRSIFSTLKVTLNNYNLSQRSTDPLIPFQFSVSLGKLTSTKPTLTTSTSSLLSSLVLDTNNWYGEHRSYNDYFSKWCYSRTPKTHQLQQLPIPLFRRLTTTLLISSSLQTKIILLPLWQKTNQIWTLLRLLSSL